MKTPLVLAIFIFQGMLLSAQPFFHLGVKAGYENTSGYNQTKAISVGNSIVEGMKLGSANGFQIGAFAQLGLSSYYLQPEFIFDVKSSSQSLLINDNLLNSKYQSNTMEIPVLFGYKLIDLRVINFHLTTGPRFIINLNSSFKPFSNLSSLGTDFTQQVKSGNWGWQFGAGFDILAVSINVDYCHYYSPSANFLVDNQSFHNSNSGHAIYLSLGWRFF
ncbi:MAG: outer membrane beta-barrel protein [Microbacter sp.]